MSNGGNGLPACCAAIHSPHDEPTLLSPTYSSLLLPNVARPPGPDAYPNNHPHHRRRHHDHLSSEHIFILVRRNQQQRELYTPNHDVRHHLLRSNPHTLRDSVWQIAVARPNSANNLRRRRDGQEIGDGVPEETSDEAHNDGELGEVVAEGGAGEDGEGRMGYGTDVPV